MKYTCVRCGKEFEARRKTAVCHDCHTAVCVVCGKQFQLKSPWTQQTCSPKCRGEYVKRTGVSKHRTEKALSTLSKRHGVSNPSKLQQFKKICKYCGEEFVTTSARRVYCERPHYGPCPVCGKPVRIKEMYTGPQACSKECKLQRTYATNIERYGCKDAVNSEHGRKKARETCLEKYGVDHYSKTTEYRQKFEHTMLGRYGNTVPLRVDDIREKARQTNQARYGVDYPQMNPDIRKKSTETAELNFGGVGFKSPKLADRIKRTNLIRYGVESPMQSEAIKQRAAQTCQKRYGADNFGSSISRLKSHMLDPTKADSFIQFRDDPVKFITTNYTNTPSVKMLCKDLGVTDTPIYNILIQNNCRDLATFRTSSTESEIIGFITKRIPEVSVVKNCRSVITPAELDIYIPDHNLAIECNPTVTHNSSLPDPWGGPPKHYKYHQEKSLRAREAGVFLFHVFGHEWTHRREIVLSMLANLLGCSAEKVYARNAEVVEVSNNDCVEFLNANHRQGGLTAKVRLGLRLKDTQELVSVMTFGKIRSTIGEIKKVPDDTVYELSRFCSKLNTSVVGGASKLFKYFYTHYDVSEIVSFSDVAHTRGDLYETLGFKKISTSDPGYVWVNSLDDSPLHRVNAQKRNLPKLFDEDIDIENKTEREIMEEHGYVRVYDSGVTRWEWYSR